MTGIDTGIEKEVQDKIVKLITALLPQVKVYLFGSRARGKCQNWSDIDLAIDAGHPLDNVITDEAKSVLEGTNIRYKVDVVDFHKMSEEMQEAVKRDRIMWKN